MNFLYSRWLQFLGFFFCHELLMAAFYFQYVEYLDPCPLCIMQRVVVLMLGITFLINGLHFPKVNSLPQKIYDGMFAVFGFAGIIVAGRQVWLQHLPKDQVPECGPGLSYMLDTLPLGEVFTKLFTGSGSCAEVVWQFMGLSMPEWMLVIFICFTAFPVVRRFTYKHSNRF